MACENIACIDESGCVSTFDDCANFTVIARSNGQWICGNATNIGITDPGNVFPANITTVNQALQYLAQDAITETNLCDSLALCELDNLGNVFTTGKINGDYLFWNTTQNRWQITQRPNYSAFINRSAGVTASYPFTATGVFTTIAEFAQSPTTPLNRQMRTHIDTYLRPGGGIAGDVQIYAIMRILADGVEIARQRNDFLVINSYPAGARPGAAFSLEGYFATVPNTIVNVTVQVAFEYSNGVVPPQTFRFDHWDMNSSYIQ